MDLDDVASHHGFGQHMAMATYNVEVSLDYPQLTK